MKKTITALTAVAALTAGSFAPASADMNPAAMWEHGKPAINAFVDYGDCSFVESHVLGTVGLRKGVDLEQVKKTFAKPSVKKAFEDHLERRAPKNKQHQGPNYEKMAGAYAVLAEALVVQRAATKCGLLKETYTQETAAWVKEANAEGLKIAQEIFGPRKPTKQKPSRNEPGTVQHHQVSGSSLFAGFSS